MAGERIRWPAVADRAREIVEGYEGGVTLCQVMYRLVYEGALPHTAPMYRRLSGQLAKARREGRFPDLIDTVRDIHVPPACGRVRRGDARLVPAGPHRGPGARPVRREGHRTPAADL
ncbi:hypothetical protein [Streptomyces violaceus]|uniref:Uncharacterized protein n=1 Tax=Streptomyces violaceus TaxID=1936 RepID=A0ABY9UJZ5_STRVL|nr:hypothetical protein [Streptomyces janthinus]WND23170.1 hypothetical protein RI060_40115 [Streptomyces janthinus]GGS56325.1 hypothetical protein GCM10010270_28680 [Streptomyces janthinus]